jgi:hypothetical protein
MNETHERQFHGLFMPPSLVEAAETGELSAVEVLLITHIATFVKNGKDKRGCFASNKYLSKLIHKKPNTTSNMICNLKKKGWVFETGFDGRKRFLITKLNTDHFNFCVPNEKNSDSGMDSASPKKVRQIPRESDSGMDSASPKKVRQIPRENEHNIYKNNNNIRIGGAATSAAPMSGSHPTEINDNFSNGKTTIETKEYTMVPKKKSTTPKKQTPPKTNNINNILVSPKKTRHPKKLKQSKETFEYQQAKLLKKIIVEKGVMTKVPRIDTFKNEISKLLTRKTHPATEERIKRVISWYNKNIGKPYVPVLYKADDFSNKFLKIEDAIRRQKEDNKKLHPNDIDVDTISDTAKSITRRLSDLPWPKGSSRQLLEAVQLSLDNFDSYMKLHKKYLKNKPVTDNSFVVNAHKWATKKLKHEIFPVDTFIRQWFERVFRQVQGWDKWNGNLRPYIFSVHHKDYQSMLVEWAQRYHDESYAEHYLNGMGVDIVL